MNVKPLFISTIKKSSDVIKYQSVRWRRPTKPFWLGLAKSKMFVIWEPKCILTSEEDQVVNLMTKKYNTEYKSIMNFICNEDPRFKGKSVVNQEGNMSLDPELEEKISLSLKANEEFNAESRRLGEEMMEKFFSKEEENAKMLIMKHEETKRKRQELIDEVIRKEKVLSESFITPENIDLAIDKCLNNVEEFDFAIDLDGNVYHGRETLEKEKKDEVNEVTAETNAV